MNFKIKSSPIIYLNTRTYDDRVVLYREDNGDPLAIVSKNFRVVQPAQVLDFFSELTKKMGYELIRAEAYKGGRIFMAQAKIPGAEFRIPGDTSKIESMLILASSCDGMMATTARYTTIRVECLNTFPAFHTFQKMMI